MTVRTRFAPSPTGYLHIGGVRTALFNWLFARKHGGQFLLRVDDTDQQRNVEAALAPILHGFEWLGMNWDEGPEVGGPCGPYYQSQRGELYQAAVEKLLASGHAYRDFATTEELQAEREAAQAAGGQFTYSRRWMAESDADAAKFVAEGRQGVVRLKMPREGDLVLNDLIRGEVRFAWAAEQDHVIQRADGTCLYHLASVVDDEAMRISHVIRAEEHLPNTPRQVFIAQSLGYELPAYAHLPYVAEPGSKTKLSKRKLDKYLKNKEFKAVYDHGFEVAKWLNELLKDFVESHGESPASIENRDQILKRLRPSTLRSIPTISRDYKIQKEMEELAVSHIEDIFKHPEFIESYQHGFELKYELGIIPNPATFNPVIVNFYEETGYLPHAILNYLLLLGWSFDDKREEFSTSEMIRYFSLDRVNKAPASFDPKKLLSFQEREMQRLTIEQKVDLCLPFLEQAGFSFLNPLPVVRKYLGEIIAAAGDRLKVAGEIVDYANFIRDDSYMVYDMDAVEKRIKKPGNAKMLLREYAADLPSTELFVPLKLEEHLKDFVEERGVKIGDLVHPVRVAITGKAVGFGLFDALAILGRERCVRRIERALSL